MSTNNTKEQKRKIIIGSAFALLITLFYSQWEIPTFLHGKEFDNPEMVDHITTKTGAMIGKPDFIKVVGYDDKKADILWVRGKEHVIVLMNKKKSKTGEPKWEYYTWITCTPANGAAPCFFPWYGGFPGFY